MICILKLSGAELQHWIIAADVPDAIRQANSRDEALARVLQSHNEDSWRNRPSDGKYELHGGYTMLVRSTAD